VTDQFHTTSPWSKGFVDQLKDPAFRHAYMADQVRLFIALQVRALREQQGRGWSQRELGEKMGKAQSAVARLEDPDYGRLTVQTLLELAAAFELPLLVEITDWKDWLQRTADQSKEALQKRPFDARELLAQHRPAVPADPSVNQSGYSVSVVTEIGTLLNSSRRTTEQAFVPHFTSAADTIKQPPAPAGILDSLFSGQYSPRALENIIG
jgi:transcriptional regulator with XRE-family HTH domain